MTVISTCALRMPMQHTCATICFCVSSGKCKKFSLPCGLPIATDLPLEFLLGPDASGLVALIADGDNGNDETGLNLASKCKMVFAETRKLDVYVY